MAFFEIVIKLTAEFLLQYPGAYIRWLVSRRKKPFKEVVNEDPMANSSVGVMLLIGIAIIIILIKTL